MATSVVILLLCITMNIINTVRENSSAIQPNKAEREHPVFTGVDANDSNADLHKLSLNNLSSSENKLTGGSRKTWTVESSIFLDTLTSSVSSMERQFQIDKMNGSFKSNSDKNTTTVIEDCENTTYSLTLGTFKINQTVNRTTPCINLASNNENDGIGNVLTEKQLGRIINETKSDNYSLQSYLDFTARYFTRGKWQIEGLEINRFQAMMTCQNKCGVHYESPCSCNPICFIYNTCCPDFRDLCDDIIKDSPYKQMESTFLHTAECFPYENGIFLVKSCPSKIEPNHEDESSNMTVLEKIQLASKNAPITDPETGITYRTRRAFDCFKSKETEGQIWRSLITLTNVTFNPENFKQMTTHHLNLSDIRYAKHDNVYVYKCSIDVIMTCHVKSDYVLIKHCAYGPYNYITADTTENHLTYKNLACLQCNFQSLPKVVTLGTSYSLSALRSRNEFQAVMRLGNNAVELTRISSSHRSFGNWNTMRCQLNQGVCEITSCSGDLYLIENQCLTKIKIVIAVRRDETINATHNDIKKLGEEMACSMKTFADSKNVNLQSNYVAEPIAVQERKDFFIFKITIISRIILQMFNPFKKFFEDHTFHYYYKRYFHTQHACSQEMANDIDILNKNSVKEDDFHANNIINRLSIKTAPTPFDKPIQDNRSTSWSCLQSKTTASATDERQSTIENDALARGISNNITLTFPQVESCRKIPDEEKGYYFPVCVLISRNYDTWLGNKSLQLINKYCNNYIEQCYEKNAQVLLYTCDQSNLNRIRSLKNILHSSKTNSKDFGDDGQDMSTNGAVRLTINTGYLKESHEILPRLAHYGLCGLCTYAIIILYLSRYCGL